MWFICFQQTVEDKKDKIGVGIVKTGFGDVAYIPADEITFNGH